MERSAVDMHVQAHSANVARKASRDKHTRIEGGHGQLTLLVAVTLSDHLSFG